VDGVETQNGIRITAKQRATQKRIVKAISSIDMALPGTVEIRRTRCGNKGCACHGQLPNLHGPYIVWTRKVAGKTVTRVLSEEQYADYKPLLENSRRLREQVTALHELTLEAIEADARRRGRPGRSGPDAKGG
jgi:hypothetical protein